MPDPEFSISEIKGLVGEYNHYRNIHLKRFISAANLQNVSSAIQEISHNNKFRNVHYSVKAACG